jgi:hypothetical protein
METGLVLAGGLVVVIWILAAGVVRSGRSRQGGVRPVRDSARGPKRVGNPTSGFAGAVRSADRLRSAAQEAYEMGWDKAEVGGKALGKCHETALVNVLYERWRVEPSAPPADEATFQAFMLESLPFNVLPIRQGRTAMVEYVVWREFPEDADTETIGPAVRQAVRRLQTDTSSDVAARLKSTPMPWVDFMA